jgi:uncharacterized protein
MTDKLAILTSLRNQIPGMTCIPGCTQCCGHTAWSKFEWDLLPKEKRDEFDFFSFKCSFCKDEGCSIHDDRTIICRMFGVMEGLPCPRGVVPDVILTKAEADFIGIEYVKEFFKGESQ